MKWDGIRLTDRGVGVGGWVDTVLLWKPVGVWLAGPTLEELWATNSWETRQRGTGWRLKGRHQ